ncbi:MAG: hypothetical protein EOP45_22785 [Sphingobacteriaceae bacterium]|nr:MAG: hypothetical protein EOP45_22785 [Sphingobacteriaceae bacterium]
MEKARTIINRAGLLLMKQAAGELSKRHNKSLIMTKMLCCVLAITLLSSGCEQHNKPQNPVELREAPSATVATRGSFIDYKKDKYRLYIGQDKDSVNKIIDLRHDYLADDGMIDDDGVTHYMNIGEDLIKSYNNQEVLPALFFTTNKKKVTAFSCSIVCALYDEDRNSISACLDSLAPYFSVLKAKGNRKKLADKLSLTIPNQGFVEEFKIDTVNKKYRFIFSYEKSLKSSEK